MNAQVDIGAIATQDDASGEDKDFLAKGKQYLTFILGNESYALNILAVKEISGWESATLIPNSPDYVKGVINLRGAIVPIIDQRIRFQVGESKYLPTTVAIIISGNTGNSERTVGFIVDAVSDVLDVLDTDMQAAPESSGTVPEHYISGLVNTEHHVVTVLDIEHLLLMENH